MDSYPGLLNISVTFSFSQNSDRAIIVTLILRMGVVPVICFDTWSRCSVIIKENYVIQTEGAVKRLGLTLGTVLVSDDKFKFRSVS